MAQRKRQIPIIIMVNEREKALIIEKMHQLGTKNMGAYIRKMAIDGYVVRLDLSDISELVSLLRRSSNNLNQYAKRAHENGRIYEADIEDIQSSLKSVWEKADQIMTRLSTID
ncbi:MAG: plasmid mobilization relaxosome protein MobC [Clostridiaceae bacterium]